MGVRYDEIGEILKLIDSSSCDEFVLETEEIKLIVRRRANGLFESASLTSTPTPVAKTNATQSPEASAPASSQRAMPANESSVVQAPMVGTFYRASSPDAPPFVEIGTRVKKGDPIGIIEVMKLFTTLYAERDGQVTEIGAENAKMVEYGQMLFVIEPN